MSEERDNDTAGEELFMEELGQVQGGRVATGPRPILTRASMEFETGVMDPVLPPPPITTMALDEVGPTLPPPPITTQALREVGPTLPPPMR